ncbi:hypothetical protein J8273_6142 [Carpediemonas membranifera]|uniref:Uncharacterized protein n=1 Tax=Carpediemonas membranifera TaxID=201153 RepID=A0A8J6B263_9EUKA|nr:hypothetical protein J8273_6142 [Carpediemonas membranifera]|eukprot:KAG9391382.1 hypothetical protein J8273_6142 [Carpediemonas membranifera]
MQFSRKQFMARKSEMNSPASAERGYNSNPKKLVDLSASRIADLNKELNQTTREFVEFKTRHAVLKQQWDAEKRDLNTTISKLTSRLAESDSALQRAENDSLENTQHADEERRALAQRHDQLQQQLAEATDEITSLKSEHERMMRWAQSDAFPSHRLTSLYQGFAQAQARCGYLAALERTQSLRLDEASRMIGDVRTSFESFGRTLAVSLESSRLPAEHQKDLLRSVRDIERILDKTADCVDAPMDPPEMPEPDAELDSLSKSLTQDRLADPRQSPSKSYDGTPLQAPVVASPYRTKKGSGLDGALAVLDQLRVSKVGYDTKMT